MRPRSRLFFTAFLAGAGFRIGLPGLADLIGYAWGKAEPVSRQVVPPAYQSVVTLTGFSLFAVAMYMNIEVFLRGAKKGRKGLSM